MADINGTAGADLLFGAAAGDLISGGDGNDVLHGGAGDDHLVGGDGDDILRGEAGNDLLEGGAGNDDLSSTDQGSDTLAGGDGNDVLFADRRRAGDSLVLDGGAGNDRLVIQLAAAAAALTAAGGDGDDSVEIFALRSLLGLSLGTGRDLVSLVGLRTSVQGGGSIVISDFQAGAAGDRISFSSLSTADFTGWNPNANPFEAGFLKATQSGADVVISASFTANGTFVDAIVLQNVLLASLTADNLGGWTWDGSAVPAQTITGSGAAETLRGNGGADEIFGLDGNDILEGHAGADTLWGGEGNDILRGGQGADQVHGEGGNDTLSAETAGDSLFGGDGDDRLTLTAATGAAAGTLSGSGGAGNDTIVISGSPATANFSVDAGSGADLVIINALAGSAVIALGDGRDRLDIDFWTKSATSTATVEVTDFATGDGGDRLEWIGFLTRTLTGWPGSARLVQSGADSLLQIDRDGGGQYVTLINFRNTDAAAFTVYNLGGFAPEGADVPGTTEAGTADADILFGTDGDDLIEGQDGRDTLLGFFGDDEIHGGAGDDSIFGSYGDDVLLGGDGNDIINPGQGEDLADGGEGNDQFIDNSSSSLGNKGFVGGAGDDSFLFFRQSGTGDILVATGDDGNDYFQAQNTSSSSRFILDGGAGNDIFDVQGRGNLTLGAGIDEIRFSDAPFNATPQSTIFVEDFAAGDLGDRLSFAALVSRFINFTPSANPFTSGYLKLVQNYGSTILYADPDGPSGPIQDRVVGILNGIEKYSLTSHNIGGYGLPFIIGTGADEIFQGNSSDNDFVGGGGNDTFLVGYGGTDFATGGSGDDLFYVATLNSYGIGNVYIAGGEGTDTLQVQSKSAEMYLMLRPSAFGTPGGQTIPASGIEIVQLLSGFDPSRGWALNSAVAYSLDIADGFAPTGAPLVLDSSLLAASERLSLGRDALHDSDAFLKLIGGAGIEKVYAGAGGSHLDGAGGDDELYAGLGSDTLIGGAGADILRVSASSGSSHSDVVDAGEGNDRVQLAGASGTVTVTLGAGSDTIEFSSQGIEAIGAIIGRNVTVTDFAAGAGGDSLDWHWPLFHYLVGQYGNPFETGYARLVQHGGDVLLQLSRLGDGNFLTLLRLQNHAVTDFASGIGGFVPLPGYVGDDYFIGTGGDDQIDGQAGNDIIDGQAGNDIIDGGAGADRMTGGTGNDIFYVDNAGDQVIEAAGEGADEIRTDLATYSLVGLSNVENLTGTSSSPQTLRGNAGNNRITGGAGADVLRLLDGGNDTVDAGGGNDTIFFGAALAASDVVNGGAGVDTLVLQGAYALILGTSADSVVDLRGIETIRLLSGSDTGFGTMAGTSSYQLTVGQSLIGSGGTVTIDGSGLGTAETLYLDARAETDGSLVVTGGAGNDTLMAGGIGSILRGGGGNDQLYAAPAGSTLEGGAGADMLFGGRGSDVMRGGDGDDRLADHGSLSSGGGASDSLDGEGGNDIVNFGRVAADVWTGASLIGGDGNDEILYSVESFGTLSIDAGSGDDKISVGTNAALTRISLGAGQDVLTLNNHQGLVKPGGSIAISDFQTGAAGDKLDWRLMLKFDMAGYMEGQNPFLTGHARLVQAGSDVLLQIDRRTGGTDSGFKTILRFENRDVTDFTAFNFDGFDPATGTGTAGADTLYGGAGNDILNAGDGNDVLYLWMGGGNDTVHAGRGADNIFFGGTLTSADFVNGGEGVDTLVVQGPYGSLALTANITEIENLSILGGNNTNFGEPGTNRYDYSITIHDSNFAAGVQARINGAALQPGEDFTFDGSAETDAKFVVYGGKGKDTLLGGLGADIFFFAEERFASGDTVNGGAGYNGMFLRGNYTIDFNAPGYTGLFTNIQNLTLTSATDERYARGGGTEFDYNLTLSDAIVKPGETLTVSGALLMESETMVLDGTAETDGLLRLFGGRAADTLKGGGQSDILHGGLGADQLTGNGGADTFRFDSVAESSSGSMDHILDFAAGTDKVDLGRIDADFNIAGNQAFAWIGSAAFGGTAGQLRAYEQDGSWFVEGDTNGDSVADLVVRITVTGGPLTQSDFLP